MDCPYCKKEMRAGSISGRDTLKWYPQGDLLFSDQAIILARGYLDTPVAQAHYCPDCRMIIMPVPEIENHWKTIKDKWKRLTDDLEQKREEYTQQRQKAEAERKRIRRRKKDPWEE